MKTSVIEVDDMLSVLSVGELEKRMDEVPGVESTTVNFAARSATVRYDETRLEISDIKSAVRQRAYDSTAPGAASAAGHKDHTAPPAPPVSGAPKPSPDAPGTAGSPVSAPQDKATSVTPKPASGAPASPAPGTPKPAPDAAAATGGHEHEQPGKTAPTKA